MNVNQTTTTGTLPSHATAAVASPRPEHAQQQPPAAPAAAAAAATAKAASATPINPEDLKNSVEAINRFLKVNSEVQFSIDETSGKSVIKVVDTESRKVLRQFPSEQALEFGKNLKGLKGLLVDNTA